MHNVNTVAVETWLGWDKRSLSPGAVHLRNWDRACFLWGMKQILTVVSFGMLRRVSASGGNCCLYLHGHRKQVCPKQLFLFSTQHGVTYHKAVHRVKNLKFHCNIQTFNRHCTWVISAAYTRNFSIVIKILNAIHYVALGLVISPEEETGLFPKGSVLCWVYLWR